MILSEQHTQVLIVGAGPSGLMMAAQLLRYGIQPIIIDSKQGPTDESKALGVQARSLEIYRQMGIVDQVLKDGKKAQGITFNRDGKQLASLSIANVGEGQTPFPFIELYPQSNNEKLVLDFLTRHACPVYWETTLASLKQTSSNVEIQLQNGSLSTVLTAQWVIGADGAHSVMRRQLNIPFTGDTYDHVFYLADVELDNDELDDDCIGLFIANKGIAGFFPMPGTGRFRVIGKLPDELDKKENPALEEVLPDIKLVCGFNIKVSQNHWFTTYRLHHRMADRFREQRCFLIGDAAHIHSPVGAQGMNTGLQDAYNLAWKLAGVINNQIKPGILDSYAEERMPVAKTLLKTTDRIFTVIMSNRWYMRLLKAYLLPRIIKYAWSKPSVREEGFKRVSQIGISYRESNLNLHISQSTKIKAGDRLPYLKVYDEKKQEEADLHEWCGKPGFTLIVLGKLAETDLFTLARWVTQNYGTMLNFYYLPYSAKNQRVFESFEINPNRAKSLIVRPDMHIGFMNDKVDMVLMDNYLRNIMGVAKSP
ncbi:MAG TPA: FAD-dependent monooxygenase [Mucilaginibacter sp.]|jgi:2-polyprenyl-6-methoxyphenol hydroxylase-like FAD-dependent oxidoreductase|nr:FAD-dependent monooxygenase [Mucilaginibacter sp.]